MAPENDESPQLDGGDAPWLLDLAVLQTDSGLDVGAPTYVESRQMTYMQEPVYEPAIDSLSAVTTKKADRETGEDQKGF